VKRRLLESAFEPESSVASRGKAAVSECKEPAKPSFCTSITWPEMSLCMQMRVDKKKLAQLEWRAGPRSRSLSPDQVVPCRV
jgi:hypothetical protein